MLDLPKEEGQGPPNAPLEHTLLGLTVQQCDEMHPVCLKCNTTGRECGGYVRQQQVPLREEFKDGPRSSPLSQRSKLGCNTCKVRKLKCDESLPVCKRCLRGSRICKWDLKRPSDDRIDLNRITMYTETGPHRSPAHQPGVSLDEKRALAFFRARTAAHLSGYHNASERWYNYLLQIGENEPAIRLGVVALGSLHEEFETSNLSPPYSTYTALQSLPDSHPAVQKYNKARILVSRAKSWQSRDVPLLACTLFASFDTLRGRPEPALFHRCSGLRILSDTNFEPSSAVKELLAGVFIGFDSENMELGEPDFSSSYTPPSTYTEQESHVRGFVTLKEAAQAFENLFNRLLRSFRTTVDVEDPGIGPKKRLPDLLQTYEEWCFATDEYLRACACGLQTIDQDDISDLIVLHLRRLILRIMLHADLRYGESQLDRFEPEFECIVTLAECFVNDCSRTGDEMSRIAGVAKRAPLHNDLNIPIDEYFTPDRAFTATGTTCGKQLDFLGIRVVQTPLMRWGSLDDNFLQSTLAVLARLPVQPVRFSVGTGVYANSSFSLAPGIVKPLWITAVRCREPLLRRRALHLLERAHRKEGQWDSLICAANAKITIAAEERRALELLQSFSPEAELLTDKIYHSWQVPNEARLRRFTAVMNEGELKADMKRFEWRATGEDWYVTVPGCTTQ